MALLFVAPLTAQQPPDSVASRVPLPRADSAARDTVPADTIKDPIAAAPRPATPEIDGRRVRWDRAAIFASGAITLTELLSQVPGVTTYHAGHIAAPTASAWNGEPGRVRVWLDGVALDPLDPREGGVQDLATIPLWPLEEVAVERFAGDLRVHLRTWRVERTTAETRTDVMTGSEETNLYRGFFGKRMPNGLALQVAAQQFSTTSVRTAGDGDGLAAFARIGWASGDFSFDGAATRNGRKRFPTKRYLISGTLENEAIGGFTGRDHAAYLRAAWRNPDSTGLWVQLLAASLAHYENGDTLAGADSGASASQYVASAGLVRGGLRLTATGRLRAAQGTSRFSPEAQASWAGRRIAVSTAVELDGPDSTFRASASAMLTPFPWLQVHGSHSLASQERDPPTAVTDRSVSRLEAAVALRGRWIRAAAIQRGASLSPGMPVFDSSYVPVAVPATTGIEAGVSGRIWGPFSFDWRGTRWSEAVIYRPLVESRGELRVRTSLERQLTRRAFDLDAALVHEYRGRAVFPAAGGGTAIAEGAGFIGGSLEIRIGNARIFWYNRNATGKVYESVPGYLMPRLVQMYGLRWEFWN